jgi:hypothetical protein
VTAARDVNSDSITGDWVNESICRTITCPGFNYSRNGVRELSTAEANRLRSLFGLAPITVRQQSVSQRQHDAAESVRFGGRRARLTAEAFNLFNTPQRLIGSSSVTSGSLAPVGRAAESGADRVQFDW